MNDNEKLIEEARRWPAGVGPIPSAAPGNLITRLADALEASEKAHTPTDDEREALAKLVNPDAFSKALWWKNEDHARHLESNARVRADEIFAAGFRRSEAAGGAK